MSERPAASHGFLILVACGIALTAALAYVVQSTNEADTATTTMPATPITTAVASAPTDSAVGSMPVTADSPAFAIPFGPAEPSSVPTPLPVAHLAGGANAAAVLALPGGSTETAALHWLDEAGVPAIVADDLDEALQHAAVVVLGDVLAADVPRLDAYARGGGVVILEQPTSPALTALAGVGAPDQAVRDTLALLPGAGIETSTLRFPASETTSWGADAGALARYPDGGAAITARQLGTGVVAAFGLHLDGTVLASESSVVAPSAPANGQPQTGPALARDALAQLARTLYGLAAPGITLGGAPDGRAAALVLTHDIDTADALPVAAELAAIERDRGVHATYFVAAQATADDEAPAILTADGVARLRGLQDLGAEIASGGVAFGDQPDLPIGDGSEAVPGYAPTLARGGASQFGEARVSRYALTAALPGLDATAFRAPAAVAPPALDGVLAGTGYTIDATPLADVVGGGLPYRLAGGTDASQEQPVLRLPLRFDDRTGLTPDRRGSELDAILESAVSTGAPAVVRISPQHGSASTYALQSLLARAPADVWIGSAEEFATFWAARSTLTLDVAAVDGGWRVRLSGRGDVPGQTLVLPFRAQRATVTGDRDPLELTGDGRRVVVPAFTDETELEIVPAEDLPSEALPSDETDGLSEGADAVSSSSAATYGG